MFEPKLVEEKSQVGFMVAANIERPKNLEERMMALADILSRANISHARTNFHAMCWWDETLAPALLGKPVQGLEWKFTSEGPRAQEIEAILARWSASGYFARSEGDAEDSEDQWLATDLVEVDTKSAWQQLMQGFVDGFWVANRPSISSWQTAQDIRSMLKADRVYLEDAWHPGGPGMVFQKIHISKEDGGVFIAKGNSNTAMMEYYSQVSSPKVHAHDLYTSGWHLSRDLATRAANRDPWFGDAQCLANLNRLSVSESYSNDSIKAIFYIAGAEVAWAEWQEDADEQNLNQQAASPWQGVVNEGTLLSLKVIFSRRNEGIGTYIIRHAISRGCTKAIDGETARNILGKHGRQGRHGWNLVGASWPTCEQWQAPSNVVKLFPKQQ